MREIELGLERFHNLIDKGSRNTMIWAPRQTGKTFALVRKFLETPNSVYSTYNFDARRRVQQMCYDLGAPDRRRDVFTCNANAPPTHGRRVSMVFMDDIDHMTDLERFLMSVYPTLYCPSGHGRIIATSTPVRPRNDMIYERFFHDEFTVTHNEVVDWRRPTVFLEVVDHFTKEQELFSI